MPSEYRSFLNIPTSKFIREEMEIRDWNGEDLAQVLGVSKKTISNLLNDKQGVSIEIARLLGKAFGQSPDYWLNLYNKYQLRKLEETEEEKEVETRSFLFLNSPVREMKKKGWIKKDSNLIESMAQLLNVDQLDSNAFEKLLTPASAYRKSEAYKDYNKYHALAWSLMAKKCAGMFEAAAYDKKKLEELASRLHKYTVPPDGVSRFIKELNNAGVKFFVLSHLSKTYVDGASFFDGQNPVIVYTGRLDRIDNFWFTVAHEIGHVLFHLKDKEDLFIDINDDIETKKNNKEEKEADDFAAKTLREKGILKLCRTRYISRDYISIWGNILEINKGIIVGILQHCKKLSPRNLNEYKTKVSEVLPREILAETLI